jgi:hypothetical protein
MQKQQFLEITGLSERKKLLELSFEQKNHIDHLVNNIMQQIKRSLAFISEYESGSDSSHLAEKLRDAIAETTDVVAQAQLFVIGHFLKENQHSRYVNLKKDFNSLDVLHYKNKILKMENIWQALCLDPNTKKTLAAKLKTRLSHISADKLNFLNHTIALFYRIAVYQKMDSYHEVSEEKSFSEVQCVNSKLSHALVESINLQAQGGLVSEVSFTGCYDIDELTSYFETLKQFLSGFNKPIVLNLGSSNHSIMIGYDPDPTHQTFVFFNPSEMIGETIDAKTLAQNVMSALSRRYIYILDKEPDKATIIKYCNHYIAMGKGIFYVDSSGNCCPLKINNAKKLHQAIRDKSIHHQPTEKALETLKQIIKANEGHESLGSSVVIMTTDVSLRKNDNSAAFVEGIKKWYQEKLSAMHLVTAKKMIMTDAADASWFDRALLSGDIDTITQFLANNVAVSYNHFTDAVKNKFPELATILLPYIQVPLMIAAYKLDIDMVRELLIRGIDVNQTASGLCALTVAVEYNNIPLIKLLLEYGANPCESHPEDAMTPMNMAIEDENTDIVELFKAHQLADNSKEEKLVDNRVLNVNRK